MTECALLCIPPGNIRTVWQKVKPLIRSAMERADFGSFAPVEQDVLEGRALLWAAYDGKDVVAACVTQIEEIERRKVCTLVACGGSQIRRWIGLLDEIEEYARAEGCSAARIIGREGWSAVLPAYRHHCVVLEKDL